MSAEAGRVAAGSGLSQQARTLETVRAEPLTPEAFAPFGEVLAPGGSVEPLAFNFYGENIRVFRAGRFESDQPVELLLNVTRLRAFRVLFFERHLQLTQTFVPLGGQPVILVVARPDARLENGLPALDEVRAFLVPGDVAVNVFRGTWHEFPFPLVDGTRVLVTGHRLLSGGLEAPRDGQGEVAVRDVEKRSVEERASYSLRVELP